VADTIRLPGAGGVICDYIPTSKFAYAASGPASRSRIAYAAVHVVADALADVSPTSQPVIDWESSLAFRRHIWSYGLGVAEVMDTAQRGMGLDWEAAKELIQRSVLEAKSVGGTIVCGAQTDQLVPGSAQNLRDVEAAYEEQCEFIESHGSQVVLMASRELARIARGPDDYAQVYGRVISQLRQAAIVHWLGDVFDPALAGYWGYRDLDRATRVCLDVIGSHPRQVMGLKLSLLDQKRETTMRAQLPDGVHMFTGDDYDYPTTIAGDSGGHSDALLGAFDMIAPAASAALMALDAGDSDRFHAILEPTVPVSRHAFSAPTSYYKTDLVFMAYLNGYQNHFRMIGGLESARSAVHLAELFVLADKAGLLRDPELALDRMRLVMAVAGVSES
jgi:hypothetical protein